jgi:hypothetical protein
MQKEALALPRKHWHAERSIGTSQETLACRKKHWHFPGNIGMQKETLDVYDHFSETFLGNVSENGSIYLYCKVVTNVSAGGGGLSRARVARAPV